MSFLDKIISSKKKIDEERDKLIEKIEDKNIKLDWYHLKNDPHNVVRVIHVTKLSWINEIYFRTLENMQAISNRDGFTISGDDITKVIDISEYGFNDSKTIEKSFVEHYELMENSSEKIRLEERYQSIISDYKRRKTEFERGLLTSNVNESRNRLNAFLNNQPLNNTIQIVEDTDNLVESDIKINAYGGRVKVPESLLPNELKQKEEKTLEPIEKRLDKIE